MRRIRESLECVGCPEAQAQADVTIPNPVNSDVGQESSQVAELRPRSRVETRSRGVQTTIRRRRRIVPLMSLHCQRPQRGLLGPVPGSLDWARDYCRALLRQSRR